MKKTIALLLMAFPLLCIAQINYEPGYFVENGSKTECLIKNMGWAVAPSTLSYKMSENDEAKTKNAKDLSEFAVGDAHKYKKFTVNIDRSSAVTEFLLTDRAPQWRQETVFLKLLVGGELSLYKYQENNFVRYFYSSDDANAEQLVYKKFMRQNEVLENNMYRQQLYNLMKDQGYTAEKFEKTDCTEDDLVQLFTEYNNAKSGKVVNLSEKRNKGYFNVRLKPGVSFTSFDMKNDNLKVAVDFSNKTSFRAGLEFEYVMPFNKNKWSFFLDPYYDSYKDEATGGEAVAKIDFQYIAIPVGIRHYMYLNQTSKIFIDAAYVASFSLNDSNISYYSYNIYNAHTIGVDGPTGFAVGGGYGYKRLNAEIRYFKTKGVINAGYWDSNYSSVFLVLGYKLF